MSKQTRIASERLINLYSSTFKLLLDARQCALDSPSMWDCDTLSEEVNYLICEDIYHRLEGNIDPYEDGKFYNQIFYENIGKMLIDNKNPTLMCVNEVGDCPICYNKRPLAVICPEHRVCLECKRKLKKHSHLTCPICRSDKSTVNGDNQNIWFK